MRLIWKEPTTWGHLLQAVNGRRNHAKIIREVLHEHYDDLMVFHACRPVDVQAYYRDGLQLAAHEKLTGIARSIFVNSEFPEITYAAFETAVARLSDTDNLRCYVGLDDRRYIESCGHYLIYGSEHICGIAAALSRNGVRDYRQVLKRFGRPTILQLALPIRMVSESDLSEFADILSHSIRRVRGGKSPNEADFTFTLRRALPSSCVIAHEQPTKIKDPLLSMQPYYRYTVSS